MASLRDSLKQEPNELVFGTSGLRGLATDMTDLECYINTLGFLRFVDGLENPVLDRPMHLAGDLRDSTPRILRAVAQAILDSGREVDYLGLVPTPTIANYAFRQGGAAIMVTGSHIPADRNGIKFYKPGAELMKEDEPAVKAAVAAVRAEQYDTPTQHSEFDENGMLKTVPKLPEENKRAHSDYVKRYVSVFGADALAGLKVVMYQHSAVGRDIIMELLGDLGAKAVDVGRSEVFIPIDSENVRPENAEYFRQIATEHPDAFAIISTDGDSDRPFLIDEKGEFHRGDMLGVLVAEWLGADAAAYPVSASDAADQYLTDHSVPWQHTRIGSPYVIDAMNQELAAGKKRVMGWEVNGGFMTGGDLDINGHNLPELATRDAFLPLLVAMLAARDKKVAVSKIFEEFAPRFTQAGLINDFPVEVSRALVKRFSRDDDMVRGELEGYFSKELGFDEISSVNTMDGVRLYFTNGDIAHLRPSGNAPQLRMYSVASTQKRADEIVSMALAEPDGIFRRMERELKVAAGQ